MGIALKFAEKAFLMDKKNIETNELLGKIKSVPTPKMN